MGEKSEKAFPFDSDKDSMGNNDREYYADDFARYFRSFISSGVFMKNADNLQILANDDMTVTLRPGSAIIDGYKYDNTADIVVELDPADGVLNRIDRISVTWSKGERDIHKTVQKGTSSYEPIAQECRRNEEYKDYVLADIYIPAGAIKITQDNITDQRLNTELCGLAMPFSDIDTTMIFNQLQAFYEKVVAENADWEDEKKVAFDEWFESVKDQLSGDVAGNLQNQIGNLEDLTTTNKGSLVEAINEVNEKEVDVLDTKEEIEANTDSGKVAGALAVKEMVGEVSASLGDISNVGNDTYNSVEKLLQYYIDNGYLPDVNNFPLLPTMTSNTSGNIVLSAISYNSDTLIYYACDGNTNTRWTANVTSTPVWWKVDFGNSYIVKRVEITFNSYATSTTFKIQGSNDNSTWTDLSSEITVGAEKEIITLNNNSSYRYYRVYISAQTTSGATKKGHIQEIQFYRIK